MRSAIEQLEDLQPYLDAAQKAAEELGRSPLRRVEGASDLLLDPELLADGIRENLCMLDCAMHAAAETMRTIEDETSKKIAALREALAPFANRGAEKGFSPGRKSYSVITDQEWSKALEVYQC